MDVLKVRVREAFVHVAGCGLVICLSFLGWLDDPRTPSFMFVNSPTQRMATRDFAGLAQQCFVSYGIFHWVFGFWRFSAPMRSTLDQPVFQR